MLRISFRQNPVRREGRFAAKRGFSVEQIVAVLKQAEVGGTGKVSCTLSGLAPNMTT
jgi:hypothetical protein